MPHLAGGWILITSCQGYTQKHRSVERGWRKSISEKRYLYPCTWMRWVERWNWTGKKKEINFPSLNAQQKMIQPKKTNISRRQWNFSHKKTLLLFSQPRWWTWTEGLNIFLANHHKPSIQVRLIESSCHHRIDKSVYTTGWKQRQLKQL